ncbi:MAG: SDR family oxidoreductase [Candidatus Eremiobacterota bacterium]
MSEAIPVAVVSDWRGTAGAAICLALARSGFSLIINGPEDEIFQLQAIEEAGKILAIPFDVTDEASLRETLTPGLDLLGRVDVLVNNLFAWNDASWDQITEEMWGEVLTHNLKGSFYCARAVLPYMLAQRYGKIINVTSSSAVSGAHLQFAASCAALHSLTRSLARELAPAVRVNTVATGLMDEPWIDEGGPELREVLTRDIPLKRLCRSDDVAEMVAVLATGCDFMTGQMIVIDGGETMR